MQLAQRLVQKGLLAEADLARVAAAQAAAPERPLHELLIEKGFAKEDQVLAVLAEEFGMDLVDLTQVRVEPETLARAREYLSPERMAEGFLKAYEAARPGKMTKDGRNDE